MSLAFQLFATVLVLNLGLGLLRVLRGPRAVDRLLAAQLFGTTGVALLLVMALQLEQPALLDVALIFVLLGLLAVVVYSRTGPPPARREPGDDHGA